LKKYILLIVIILFFSFTISCVSTTTKSETWYDGIWYGTGFQPDIYSFWSIYVEIDVSKDKFFVSYPSLTCGGRWRIVEEKDNYIKFKEKIEYGKGLCVDDGYVVLEYVDENHLEYASYYPDGTFAAISLLIKANPHLIKE
jgi:hypothetical protein